MRMIRQEMAELSKNLSLLTRPSLRGGGGTGIFFLNFYFILRLFEVLIKLYYRLSMARSPNLRSDFPSELLIG
jgi:hypothetical protein